MLIISNQHNEILLQRRPPAGIWGGLLGFPEIRPGQSVKSWCKQQLGLSVVEQNHWPLLRHTFSHFHLDITPIIVRGRASNVSESVMEDQGWIWYKGHPAERVGLAAPVKKLLTQLQQQFHTEQV